MSRKRMELGTFRAVTEDGVEFYGPLSTIDDYARVIDFLTTECERESRKNGDYEEKKKTRKSLSKKIETESARVRPEVDDVFKW